MATKYLQRFPKPLLDDLVAGRWLPIVGAGFSRNAVLPPGKSMPLWTDLGDALASDLGDYAAASPLDAISAYEHEYRRPRLIERLSELLLVNDARPGDAHRAFCSIPFDLVCTTNFDFLLERQYELMPRHCTPLIDEEQLAVNLKDRGVGLLKLHGDLHHPARLVATESDYDRFLDAYPLIATFLANLLITRTAVFVGYSLDDPDFRQVWQIVGERLGRSRRTAYTLAVNAKSTDVSRFERRGVKVIELASGKARYSQVLTDAFVELGDHWRANVIPASQVKEEESLRELSLPPDASTRLCFFAIPLKLQSFYRDHVFPVVRDNGLVPVTADDVVAPGDSVLAKIEALIERAFLIVVDASSQNTTAELQLAAKKIERSRLLVVIQRGARPPVDVRDVRVVTRPDIAAADPQEFVNQLQAWLHQAVQEYRPELLEEPSRLLRAREYRAAVIAAISLLENVLRERLELPKLSSSSSRAEPLRQLLLRAQEMGVLRDQPAESILEWLRVRNEVVHTPRHVTKAKAEEIVGGVLQIVQGNI